MCATRLHASWIQHEACFIMAYALKPICCTLVEVVARDTARLRVKVSVGFAAREGSRVHRMSPGALSKVNTRELLAAEEGAFSLSTFLTTLSVGLFMNHKFAFRTAYIRETRDAAAADISGIIPAADVSEVVVSSHWGMRVAALL